MRNEAESKGFEARGFAHREGLRPHSTSRSLPAPLPTGVPFDTSARAGGGVESWFPNDPGSQNRDLGHPDLDVDSSPCTSFRSSPALSIRSRRRSSVSRRARERGAAARWRAGSVVEDSLQFCYGIATDGTPLEGSRLVVNLVPVTVHCDACGQEVEIASLQSFRCPSCESRSPMCARAGTGDRVHRD